LIHFAFPSGVTKKYVDIEDDPKPTHQQGLGRPKRLHTTCNVARTWRKAAPPASARIEGVILLHPSFCGEQRLEDEAKEFWEANKKRWAVIFPGASNGSDDPRINPMAAGAGEPGLAKLASKKLFVSTASEDPRAPRGRAYCDAVRTGCWTGKLQWFESQGKGHCFFVHDYGSHEAVELMDRAVAFLRSFK